MPGQEMRKPYRNGHSHKHPSQINGPFGRHELCGLENRGFLDRHTVKSCLNQQTDDKTVWLASLSIASGLGLDSVFTREEDMGA